MTLKDVKFIELPKYFDENRNLCFIEFNNPILNKIN
jgi:hypothetical protein